MSSATRAVALDPTDGSVRMIEVRCPQVTREREVLVEMVYGGVCGTDVHLAAGHYAVPPRLVPGHEGIGRVLQVATDAVDADGRRLEPGQLVMWASSISCGKCWQCTSAGEPTLCNDRATYGVSRETTDDAGPGGSWCERLLLPGDAHVASLPPDVSALDAMALACAGPTVLHAILERRSVKLGECVVVQGTGPVGLAAMMYARLAGAGKIIAIGAPDNRLRTVGDMGLADDVLDFRGRDHNELVRAVCARTPGGRGADLTIECAGTPDAVAAGVKLTRRGGDYLVVGQYTDAGSTPLNPHVIVHRQLSIYGSWGFAPHHLDKYLASLRALCARWPLASLVTCFPLHAAGDALSAVEKGSTIKAVLDPATGADA